MNKKLVTGFLIVMISFVPQMLSGQNTLSEKQIVKMGASQVNITPEKPTLMAGYAARKTPFTGVHDSLYASALYFTNESNKALLITADLIGFGHSFVDDIKQKITAKTGIPSESIFIIAAHNHDGPSLQAYDGYDYPEVLKEKMISAATEASKSVVPIRMAIGKGTCNLNMNRRAYFADSIVWLGKNPDAPCDMDVDVVKFEDMNNKPIAFFVNWPCHGVTMGQQNYEISGDWLGAAASYIKKREGKNVVVAVTAGASGNLNPIYHPGDDAFIQVAATGYHVGVAALKALTQIKAYPVEILRTTNQVMNFPGKKFVSVGFNKDSYPFEKSGKDTEIRLSLLKLGDLVLAGISGELFTEIGMQVKKQSPYSATVIVTHCNGSSGYIPTDKAYSEGGYEIQVTRLMPGVEKPLINKFLELIHSF